jgi:hypothetical protein
MNGVRHPFSGALYERDGEDMVKVTLGLKIGRFASDGRWISGELREADPQLCGWVGGRRMSSARYRGTAIACDETLTAPPGA